MYLEVLSNDVNNKVVDDCILSLKGRSTDKRELFKYMQLRLLEPESIQWERAYLNGEETNTEGSWEDSISELLFCRSVNVASGSASELHSRPCPSPTLDLGPA